MRRHGFVDRPAHNAATAASLTCALQAQDAAAARLGVRARSTGLTDADVLAAVDRREVVRTWLMRNTIHLVASDDVRWLAALFGPMIRRRFAAKRWPELGLDPKLLERAAEAAADVLADAPLTRHEIVAGLIERGISIEPTGQAPTHVLLYLATLGLTCHADGDRFALIDAWLPGGPAGPRGDEALAELARRWFRAYSPATGADFTTWSGLPSGRAIALIRDELVPAAVNGRPGFRLGDADDSRSGVRLLGGFDNYLVGYRDRDPIIAAEHRAEIYEGGIIRPAVLQDGRVIGRWRLARPSSLVKPISVEVRLFGRSHPEVQDAIAAEIQDIGRFLGREARGAQLRE